MKLEIDIYTDQINFAVLKLPERNFPGVLFQGDSLAILERRISKAISLIKRGEVKEALEWLELCRDELSETKDFYVKTIIANGFGVPF